MLLETACKHTLCHNHHTPPARSAELSATTAAACAALCGRLRCVLHGLGGACKLAVPTCSTPGWGPAGLLCLARQLDPMGGGLSVPSELGCAFDWELFHS